MSENVAPQSPVTLDPREHVRGFEQILSSPSKRLGFFFGAGTSMAAQASDGKPLISGVEEMTMQIAEKLPSGELKSAFLAIQKELQDAGEGTQIEYVLSNVRLKAQVIGGGTLCGLTKGKLLDLEKRITGEICKLVSPAIPDYLPAHQEFARWVQNAERRTPIEIFLTNYDYLFEIAFEREKVPYFDGFVGGHSPFFHPSSVSENSAPSDWVRLWKVHGSLGWRFDKKLNRIVREMGGDELIVFPSLLKYDDSRKQPFVSYIDRLAAFIRQEDSFLIVSGYSFGDQHLNETIMDALARSRGSAVFAFLYENLAESSSVVKLAQKEPKLSVLGRNAGVIGGRFGEWRLNREPSRPESVEIDRYFDEDGVPAAAAEKPAAKPAKDAKEIPVAEKTWAGSGQLRLGDFQLMVKFLLSMLPAG